MFPSVAFGIVQSKKNPPDEQRFGFTERCTEGCVCASEDSHPVNWLGPSEGKETVLALSERRIDALKRRSRRSGCSAAAQGFPVTG